MPPLSLSALVVLAPVLLFGCGGTPADPDFTCDPGATARTLTAEVQAVLDARCKSCHVSGYAYGDYTTAQKTFENTTGKTSYLSAAVSGSTLKVVDGANKALANSSLWLKVLGGDASNRKGPKGEGTLGAMPNDGTVLTADQKELLKEWICTGGAQ
ncbi:MAG: hypothetical protein AMXMBFR34_41230 [Myxococcaceae bacterium]